MTMFDFLKNFFYLRKLYQKIKKNYKLKFFFFFVLINFIILIWEKKIFYGFLKYRDLILIFFFFWKNKENL